MHIFITDRGGKRIKTNKLTAQRTTVQWEDCQVVTASHLNYADTTLEQFFHGKFVF